MKYVIGIDIGGTNTKIGLIGENGHVLSVQKFATAITNNFHEYLSILNTQCNELIQNHQIDKKNILGVGVGAPNANYQNGHIENPPNIPSWGHQEFVKKFSSLIQLPVALDNDANLAALGEKIWGKAQKLDHFIVVTLGTGLGTGIVSHGVVIRGHNSLASEGGHTIVDPNGRACDCGGIGHLEMYASVKGIKQTVKELSGQDLQFREISKLYADKDPTIVNAFEYTARMLAMGLANMANLFGPSHIILAGGVAGVGENFIHSVQNHIDRYLFNPLKKSVIICGSDISTTDGAILGAAALALCKT